MRDEQYDIFLSHTSEEDAAVERIAEKLRDAGFAPWIDNWNCAGGGRFQREIDAGIEQSRAFAACIGESGISGWVADEMETARSRAVKDPSFRFFVVMLPGYPDSFDRQSIPATLRNRGWVDFRKGFENARQFREIVDAIQGRVSGPESRQQLDPSESPYRGLEVFDEEHAEFYFGREIDIDHLIEKLREHRFLAVVGPSGTGKSSLVRAGLIPALRNGRMRTSERWTIAVIRPGARPLASLTAELLRLDPSKPFGPTVDHLATDTRTLDHASQLLFDQTNPNGRLVLVIDQFEELFTLCTDDEERQHFIDNLYYASTVPDGRCMVVITLRADFYGRCARFPKLAELVGDNQVLIGPLGADGLREIITKPAYKAGLQFEDGLVDLILDDVARQPGALPLLEHALFELWKNRRGNLLTLEGYQASGGVAHAIAKTAEDELISMTIDEQATARRMFLRLTEPGEGTEDTRRRARIDELVVSNDDASRVEAVIDRLVAARLITTSVAEEDSGQRQVDVAHEALIRGWPRLKSWIDEDRAGLRIQRRIAYDAFEWQRRDYNEDSLYRGARLLEASEYAQRPDSQLNQLETTFIGWGLAIRDRELVETEQRRIEKERRQKKLTGVAVVASLFFLALGLLAWQQKTTADNQRSIADGERANAVTQGAIAEQNAQAAQTSEANALAQKATAESNEQAAQDARSTAQAETTRAVVAEAGQKEEADKARTAEANAVAQQVTAEANATEAGVARDEADVERENAVAQQAIAEANAQESKGRELAAISMSDSVRIDQALLAGIEASDLGVDGVPAYLLPQIFMKETRFSKILTLPDPAHALVPGFCAFDFDDGEYVVAMDIEGTLHKWDLKTSRLVSAPRVRTAAALPNGLLRCHPNAALIATYFPGDDTMSLWNANSFDLLYTIPISDLGPIVSFSFSTTGKDLIIVAQLRTYFWNITTESFVGRPWAPHGLQVPQNGTVVSADNGRVLYLLQSTGTIRVFDDEAEAPYTVQMWDPSKAAERQYIISGDGTRYAYSEIVASEVAGFTLSITFGTIDRSPIARTFDLKLPGDSTVDSTIVAIAISRDNKWVAAATLPGKVWLFAEDPTSVYAIVDRVDANVLGNGAASLGFVGDDGGHLATMGFDNAIVIWDLTRLGPVTEAMQGEVSILTNLAASSDGSIIAGVSCLSGITVWNRRGEELWHEAVDAHGQSVCVEVTSLGIAITGSGTVVAAARLNGEVIIVDTALNAESVIRASDQSTIVAMQFVDEDRILLGIDVRGMLHVWDISDRDAVLRKSIAVVDGPVFTGTWSNDGRYLAVLTGTDDTQATGAYQGQLVEIDAEFATSERLDLGNAAAITALDMDDEGTRIMSVLVTREVIEWTRQQDGNWARTSVGFDVSASGIVSDLMLLPSGLDIRMTLDDRVGIYADALNPLLILELPSGMFGDLEVGWSIAAPDDGSYVVAGYLGGVWIWHLDTPSWRASACESAGRNFTMAEWQEFFGDEPYRRTCEQFPDGWGVSRTDEAA